MNKTVEKLNPSPIRLEWDPAKRKEVEEAKEIYRQAKNEGRIVRAESGEELGYFNPWLGSILIEEEDTTGKLVARVWDETGDRRLIWDSTSKREVQEAMQEFQKFLDQGCKIYAVDSKGNKRYRIYKFDPMAEELFVSETGTREKLKDFLKEPKAVVLPRSYPG